MNIKIDFSSYKKKLLFLPLGGADEIGINLNLYHYNGKWIMVDCGIGFADDHLSGVDMIVADLSFIKQYNIDLIGLILTHAHEDHLGAIPYLWNYLKCPIYGTKFTTTFLKSRLEEFVASKKLKIIEVSAGSEINLDPFVVKMIPLTHSAPEMQALLIKTEVGNIFHTGDWKFDYSPVVGNVTDKNLLKSCGEEGVLALICDSTNVFETCISKSEGDLRESLVDIIVNSPQLVVVTIFASNIARINTLIYAAKKAGRKIALCGRSLHRMSQIAQETGYLTDTNCFIDSKDISKYKRENILIIATGCQGEPLAAITKMAKKNHNDVKLAPKDKVIFSSKIIPGNEKKIFFIMNALIRSNIEVITERDHFVHVSGHANIDELTEMYALLKPKIAVPVHGNAMHIHEHAKLAKKLGVQYTIESNNGMVIKLDKDGPKVIGTVQNGYLGIDGNCLLHSESQIFKMRKKMSINGLVIVTILLNSTLKIINKPIIVFPGCLDNASDNKFIEIIKSKLHIVINDLIRPSLDDVSKTVRSYVKKTLKESIGKEPEILVNVEQIKAFK